VIGYIRPLVRKLRTKAKEVHVFERNPQLRRALCRSLFSSEV
jgi:hypothetical protein